MYFRVHSYFTLCDNFHMGVISESPENKNYDVTSLHVPPKFLQEQAVS